MPVYRTPLPALFAGVMEAALNRVLALDAQSQSRLGRLQGKSLLLVLEGTGLEYIFSFDANSVFVTPNDQEGGEPESDTVVSATPVALFSMAVGEMGEGWQAPDSRVSINGDANFARDFERLFSRLDPDIEGTFSAMFGDVIGHQVAVGLREGARRARETAGTAGEVIGEVLREGPRGNRSGPLVSNQDVRAFAESVDDLRDAVERMEASVRILMQESDGEETEGRESGRDGT